MREESAPRASRNRHAAGLTVDTCFAMESPESWAIHAKRRPCVDSEFELLRSTGVEFMGESVDLGFVMGVMFEDTCGSFIRLVQPAI